MSLFPYVTQVFCNFYRGDIISTILLIITTLPLSITSEKQSSLGALRIQSSIVKD